MGAVWLISGRPTPVSLRVPSIVGTASGIGSRIADLFERQPFILGALGLAIGAGVATTMSMRDAEAAERISKHRGDAMGLDAP
jgi:hypothetical protein